MIGKLKGDTLFKGKLLIAIRDVSSKDSQGVEEETLRNMEELKNKGKHSANFLAQLFNDKFDV